MSTHDRQIYAMKMPQLNPGSRLSPARRTSRITGALALVLATMLPSAALGQVGTWAANSPMAIARQGAAAATVNGRVYAIGGYNRGPLATVEAYDSATGAWTTMAPMPTARSFLAAAVVDGKIYAIGGFGGVLVPPAVPPLPTTYDYTGAVEVYDPTSNTWTAKASMTTARYALAVAVHALGVLCSGAPDYNGAGYLFIAFKPDLFVPLEDYRRGLAEEIAAIKATPRQGGVDEIRIPGERAYRERARLSREGIEIDRRIHDALIALADGKRSGA